MQTIRDFKTAFHSLNKAKVYVITIVLTLGITLGALVAMFNLNYQLLAAPLPYPNADKLYIFQGQNFESDVLAWDDFAPFPAMIAAYQSHDDYFEQKALLAYTTSVERRLPDHPLLSTVSVTPELLPLLQAPMALGRHFSADEGLNTMTPVAIISFATWQRLFQQDPQVLGKTLNIMEVDFKIIGVLAEHFIEPGFYEPGRNTDIWLPLDYHDLPHSLRKRWDFGAGTYLVGLLKPDVKVTGAEHYFSGQISARFKMETASLAHFANTDLRLKLSSFKETIVGDSSKQSLLMFAGVLVLMLISGTNIVNLILSRAASLQRTMAIQVALGAQQKDIFTGVLAEILLLMTGAATLSIAISLGILEVLKVIAIDFLPRLNELHLNFQTVMFSVLVALALAFVFAIIVSRLVNYRALNGMLQSSGKGAGLQISARVRRLLIFSQVILTAILLVASVQVLTQSWQQIKQPLGYDTANQYQVLISIATLIESTTGDERRNFFYEIQNKLKNNPKVEQVGLASRSPVGERYDNNVFLQADYGSGEKIGASAIFSDGTYLDILRIPLIEGRYYSDAEARDNAGLILVNETFARLLQADGLVINKRVYRYGESNAEGFLIIGVVKDLQLPGKTEVPRFFQSRVPYNSPEILIHVKPHQTFTAREINALAASIHPQLKIWSLQTTQQAIEKYTTNQKTVAGLAGVLALLALGLAAIGIYGVLSYSVQQRRFELGVRMAIGARPVTVFLQVLKDTLMPVIVGLLVSLVILTGLWFWVQQTSLHLEINLTGWLLPVVMILTLTTLASLVSVWKIITKPANYSLRTD